ncbi:MAG: hypothetical protein VW683_10165 [Betaproteobacteria bacterium]|jgi:hypothetical protein
METLVVSDGGVEFEFEWQDLVKFHGHKSICGLSVSFKAMECAWTTLFDDSYPSRDSLRIEAGFAGPGIIDGFELVTRAVSRDRFTQIRVEPSDLIAEASSGVYYFKFSCDDREISLGLKPRMVPTSFINARRKLNDSNHTLSDRQNFKQAQLEFYKTILDSHPLGAFNVLATRKDA